MYFCICEYGHLLILYDGWQFFHVIASEHCNLATFVVSFQNVGAWQYITLFFIKMTVLQSETWLQDIF